jgi:Kef-type K+ transport system membrane component KefB
VSFWLLAVIGAVALAGSLLALPRQFSIPAIVGELAAGLVIGVSGFGVFDTTDSTATFLADVGFALVMFVAGTHVPVRDPRLRRGIRIGSARSVAVGIVATGLAAAIGAIFDSDHIGLYAVLIASSSAAAIMPIIDSRRLSGPAVVELLPQIAIADAACIVALPLVIDPPHAARAALGSMAVIGCAALAYLVLHRMDHTGWRRRIHRTSHHTRLALELRIDLVVLFTLAAVAVATHVSIMLAGFAFGIVVAAVGEPRRLSRQLFGITEGFFGPYYFVWLGASLDLGDLWSNATMIALGVVLGLAAVAAHVAMRLTGQPISVGALAAAQLGVPVSAVTLGAQLDLFSPGEGPAIILGALVTLAATTAVRPAPIA